MTLKELGQTLREHREASGLSLDDVAARIKLSTRLLASIEEGATAGMPHAVYTKRFIRTFGEIVGYDPDDLNYKLELVFPPESLESRSDFRLRHRMNPTDYSGARHLAGMLFILAVLAGLAAGGWFLVTNHGDDIIAMIKRPFSAVSPTSTGEEPVRSGQPAQSAQFRTSSPDGQPVPGSGLPVDSAGGQASSNVSNAGMSRVQMTAAEDCWISCSADGGVRREYTLRAGESFVLTYVNSLVVTLSNGGAVTVAHNGRNLGRAGNPGQRVELHFPFAGN